VSLILATILSAAALAQTSPSQPPPQPVATAATETKKQGRHVDKHGDKRKTDLKKDDPDPALLGFLGDYEDAADGLDPIGLSEQADSDKPKDGRGP